jgi:hypothetical protein
MALSILDGNQSATTLSTILSSGQHITAHTVVSLGTQAITDITSAVSGTSVCVGSISISGTPSVTGSVSVLNFPASQSTTFGAVTGSVSVLNFPASQSVTFSAVTGSVSILNFPASQAVTFSDASLTNTQLRASAVTVGGTVTVGNSVTISSLPAISGTVTANLANVVTTDTFWGTEAIKVTGGSGYGIDIAGIDNAGNTAVFSEGGGIPVYPRDNLAYGASFPISGTVTANTFAIQGTAVTTSNFTSTTASTVLASYNATREVLTIFNEGAGNLHIAPGATCTTIAYQVRLSAGDYYEVPNHQTTITHSAVFATAGTARVTQVS